MLNRDLVLDKFWNRVQVPCDATDEDCWEWAKAKNENGYGVLRLFGRNKYAHIVSYMLYKGDVGSMNVLHKCDSPSCVNPSHLFLGYQRDNVKDMVSKGRTCKGINRPNAVLTWEQVCAIRQSHKEGVKSRELAAQYGLHMNYVHSLLRLVYRKDC